MIKPSFCSNPKCIHHKRGGRKGNWYKLAGSYETKAFGTVQRYQCRVCGKTFSDQTFKIDYYAKRVIDYKFLFEMLTSSAGIRDIARDCKVSTETIQNKFGRLARQAIAIISILKGMINLQEDLVADGFESYCVNKYYINNINILVGKESQHIYFMNYVTIRRKGRMTTFQKEKRERLERIFRADPKGITKAFHELCLEIADLFRRADKEGLVLYTDMKIEYKTALGMVSELSDNPGFIHSSISSNDPRNWLNNLFAVNYMDREFRKDLSNHVRRTVQYAKNVNDCMGRMMIYQLYHNFVKVYRIKNERYDKRSHAEVAGLDRQEISRLMHKFFTRRFVSTIDNVSGEERKIWFREYQTPLKVNPEYHQKVAAA